MPSANVAPSPYTKRSVPLRADLLPAWLPIELGNIQRALPNNWAWPPLSGEVGVRDLKYYYGDVRRYGALGDGTTNDQNAIQYAWDALGLLGGGTLYFPAGHTYLFSGRLTNATASNIVVSGYGATLKANTAAANHELRFGTSAAVTVSRIVVEGLAIDLTDSGGSTPGGIAAFISSGLLVRDVTVTAPKSNGGIQILGPTGAPTSTRRSSGASYGAPPSTAFGSRIPRGARASVTATSRRRTRSHSAPASTPKRGIPASSTAA
jgi:hypothetical protein